ncbi:Uncharacterized protein OS=Marichromatium purpuratum 984 GN=MARPU_09545 PE=4 SV=1 [Gemmata massiliana]|uniref:Uncharacterized protein n=1 Tax=Gemmata massiliana TaxID=1210884 RepID=A0A6P2DKN7_9BACT|nr:hypothetical protein [Gemmata massiliana]VTS03557.1 Uncharacterized protein OS=Marichromatium purpuratum 984 GN=MARPU_09545 PE=4 SV=1 [Gemmata massiliana]
MKPTKYKTVLVTPPAAIVNNAAFATATIDTLGFSYLEIFVAFGAMDIGSTLLKVQESDDPGMSGAVDVVGTRVGTDPNDTGAASTLPSATSDNTMFKFEIDLKGRKRYLDLFLTGGNGATGTFAVAWANLHEGDSAPTSAADKGVAQLMRAPIIS